MRVRDWMTRAPVTVTPHATIHAVRRVLHDCGFRHLPVVEDGRLVGMVSDRDVVIHDRDLQMALTVMQSELGTGLARPVSAVMSAPSVTIAADERVEHAARTMMSRHVSALPVVDGDDLVGIITTTDCLRALLSVTAADARQPRRLSAMPPD